MELKVQQETHEKRVLDFLIKVEKQNPQAAKQWNKKFLGATSEACQ